MGFSTYIDGLHQGSIITTFFFPTGVSFQFSDFYNYIKERGYAIYPGKLTDPDTFRIGNIGEIYKEDIEKVTAIIADYLKVETCQKPSSLPGLALRYGCFAPVQAFREAFAHFDVFVTMEETRKPIGMLKREHIRTMLNMERIASEWKKVTGHAVTHEDTDAVYAQFEPKLFSIPDRFADPKPYVLETVNTLPDRGLKIGSTTGYMDSMMNIVVSKAAELGYTPDCWFSPDAVNGKGRPYPYMIFENLKALEVTDVKHVLKVGDTVSDIKEGVNASV